MKVAKIIVDVLTSALRYGVQERERILYLLPLLLLLGVLFGRHEADTAEEALLRYTDRVVDSLHAERRADYPSTYRTEGSGFHAARPQEPVASADSRVQQREHKQRPKPELFAFDPNSVTLEELIRLGFSAKQAQVILNYRTAGARFRAPADFARCYTVSEQMYERLLPYISITSQRSESLADSELVAERAITGNSIPAPSSSTPTASDTLPARVAQTPAPRTAWRSEQEIARARPLVEINTADSATLDGIYGVGALTAERIIAYREALGGFARKEQLAELRGMTDQNYQRILTQIFVDSSLIQKIDVNFATPSELNAHPYVDERTTDRILKQRQLKGGWRTIQELKKQHIITQEQAIHLAPYFSFGEQ